MKGAIESEDRVTTDDVVKMAIEDLFPDHTVPDKVNYLANGQQYKAPDHAIFNGRILIERKSRNGADNSRFYQKLKMIGTQQGAPFYAVGKVNLRKIIQTFPDPVTANMQMIDFMLRKTMKHVRDARHKIEEYEKHVPGAKARILIISDNTDIRAATAADEHYLGRKMGALCSAQDEVAPLDAIFFIKDPRYVIDEENSYWFKCLVKEKLPRTVRTDISQIAARLHYRISSYGPYYSAAQSFRRCEFRMTLV